MNKRFFMLLFLFLSCGAIVQAQFWNEWFRQNTTQRKYLAEQIAQLQLYLGVLNRGYEVAKEGWGWVEHFKSREFRLHDLFYKSLKNINPRIRNYARIADIMTLQFAITRGFGRDMTGLRRSGQLGDRELDYFSRVFARLLDESTKTLDALLAVLSPQQLEMKDDERMERIDRLYGEARRQYRFYAAFSNQARALYRQRQTESVELDAIKNMYDLKK